MHLQQRKNAFVRLGEELSEALAAPEYFTSFFDGDLERAVRRSGHENGWFDGRHVRYALEAMAESLTEKNLDAWLSRYPEEPEAKDPKAIGLILAGNIPAVGFHDFLSVLISGNRSVAKLSSKDKYLLPTLGDALTRIEPEFRELIHFKEERLGPVDAIIATGSNNSAGYFEYYFGKYPNIIRKNRVAVAVLTGEETPEELQGLGRDIFQYYGLGCRNVSKLFVPKDYDFAPFFEGIFSWGHVSENSKYYNNYHYNRTVWLMNKMDLLDNDFVVLKEDEGWVSPVGTLFYERFTNRDELTTHLKEKKDQLQCVVSKDAIPFGQAQYPTLWDYADGVDTLAFLADLTRS